MPRWTSHWTGETGRLIILLGMPSWQAPLVAWLISLFGVTGCAPKRFLPWTVSVHLSEGPAIGSCSENP